MAGIKNALQRVMQVRLPLEELTTIKQFFSVAVAPYLLPTITCRGSHRSAISNLAPADQYFHCYHWTISRLVLETLYIVIFHLYAYSWTEDRPKNSLYV